MRTRMVFAIVAALTLCTGTAWAGSISVDVNDGGCVASPQGDPYTVVYCAIQDAIDDAASSDTINVAAGTYSEYVHIDKDGLTVQGAGIDQSVIDLDGLTPYWHYGMLTSSFSGRGGVSIDGYLNVGGTAELVEDVTFSGFTVQNAGVNPPMITGTHTGPDNVLNLADSGAAWTPGALVGQWVTNASDYIDNSGGRQFFRAEITANTATAITATYISGGDEQDWDIGDTYVITAHREWYDGALEGREDVRGIRITSGKNITIDDCKVQFSGGSGLTTGRSRFAPRLPSENITITNSVVSDNHHGGIQMGDTTGIATITGNTVSDNKNPVTEGCVLGVDGWGTNEPDCHTTGMHIGGRSNSQLLTGEISGNTVSGNAYIGIVVYRYTDGFLVEGNDVTGHNLNWEGAGIFLTTGWGFTKTSKNHTVRGNTVTGNIRGIIAYFAWGDTPGDLSIEGNTVATDSGLFDLGQAAIKIDNSYNLQVLDNGISCDGVGIRVHSSDSYDNTFDGNVIDGAMFAGVYLTSGTHDNSFTSNIIANTIADTFSQYADWGTHDGANGQSVLADSAQAWVVDEFVGFTVINLTDGGSGTITANGVTTVTATLAGGTEDDWDTGDEYDIVFDETQADGVLLRGGSVYAGGHAGTGNTFSANCISGNAGDGMENFTAATADAQANWWGAADGPSGEGPGSGDSVTLNVDYSLWAVAPDCPCTVDAQCSDGLACNGVETCNVGLGACEAGTPVVCSGQCETGACVDPAGTCEPKTNGTVCSGNPDTCSIADNCQAGVCEEGGGGDTDTDGLCDADDNCPDDANAGQADADVDDIGDVCDTCPDDPDNDVDGDLVCGDLDNCPDDANADQSDVDGDLDGDACDTDDGPGTMIVTYARLKPDKAATASRIEGRLLVRATVDDTLTGTWLGESLTVDGDVELTLTAGGFGATLPLGLCEQRNERVTTCKAGTVKASFRIMRADRAPVPDNYNVRVKQRRVPVTAAPTSPVSVTLTQGARGIDRGDDITNCWAGSSSTLTCRE